MIIAHIAPTDTRLFVDDVFHAVKNKSFLPGYVPPMSVAPPSAALPKPTRSGVPIDTNTSSLNGRSGSNKRTFNDMQGNDISTDPHFANGTGQPKQMRRGARGRGGVNRGRGGRSSFASESEQYPDVANFYAGDPNAPVQFPGYPSMEGYPDPFAAMAALQAMGFPGSPQIQVSPVKKRKGKCRDYDTKGYCARGDLCPYQHGLDHMVVPGEDEYDPKNPTATSPTANGHSHQRPSRGRGDRPGRQGSRADFSHAGPLNDRSATTIVVEQIPEDKFNEEEVRNFFSEFGSIAEVTMQPYKRLALVKYGSHSSAQDAFNSPKVIFDNLFVKVYWYKPNKLPTPPTNTSRKPSAFSPSAEEQPFDREDFERKSQEAQRKLEEKKAQIKELATKREQLEKQKADLAQKQAEERKRLLERAGKVSSPSEVDNDAQMTDVKPNGTTQDDENVSASTRALRAKLAELEAEATSLGIERSPTDEWSPRGRGRGRGRGSYRGWEGFAGSSFRGSPRGRGGFRGWTGGGKYNLDLRTRKIGISGVEWNSQKDEALRQYLLVCLFPHDLSWHTDGT